MKVLVTGASGKTGEAITRIFSHETEYELFILSSQADLIPKSNRFEKFKADSLDKKLTKTICMDIRPDVIINTAAMNDVDLCETEKRLAWELNVYIVENLARICKILDSHFITFSSDYIFDGSKGPYSEEDLPRPINYYGKSKLAGENAAKAGCDKSTIIRTNVVYGQSSYGKNDFIRWIRDQLENGNGLNIIEGQWCNPTFTDDLALASLAILDKSRYGVYNVSGADWLNRYEIAIKAAEIFGFDPGLVRPIPPTVLKQKAKRPEKGGLVNLKAETDLSLKFSGLESGIQTLKYQLDN